MEPADPGHETTTHNTGVASGPNSVPNTPTLTTPHPNPPHPPHKGRQY